MVTDRYQRVMHHPTIDDLVSYAREHALPIVAIDNVEGSKPLETTPLPRECIILFGQEGPGLSAEALAAADLAVEITQFGSTRSLNASAAAAIVMHQWVMTHQPLAGD
jgi:tRNA G18 (ribose-2'-O)-methylase SpoU